MWSPLAVGLPVMGQINTVATQRNNYSEDVLDISISESSTISRWEYPSKAVLVEFTRRRRLKEDDKLV